MIRTSKSWQLVLVLAYLPEHFPTAILTQIILKRHILKAASTSLIAYSIKTNNKGHYHANENKYLGVLNDEEDFR